MSWNSNPEEPRLDARVRRTRDRLGDALVELIQERPFESITVQHVLERAGVSRSAFYAHFSGKEDLLLTDADEFFARLAGCLAHEPEPSERLAPVAELFAHVAEVQPFVSALKDAGRYEPLMRLGQGHFARGIAQRLERLPRARGVPASEREALSEALAGSLIALLGWWLARATPETPAELDRLFHRLAWAGIAAPDGRRP